MGRRVTVAYEDPARERKASKAAAKLVWHRDDSGLYADGCGGRYQIARQRPTRRHGIYKWGVRLHKSGLAGLDVGSADDISGAKALANRHDRAGAREEANSAVEESKATGNAVRAALRSGQPFKVSGPCPYCSGKFQARRDTQNGDVLIRHSDPACPTFEASTTEKYLGMLNETASEERRGGGSYRVQVVKALRLMGRSDAEAYADRRAQDVERYEVAGVDPTVAAAILDAADTGFDDMRGQEAGEAKKFYDFEWAGMHLTARYSSTRRKWEVIEREPGFGLVGGAIGIGDTKDEAIANAKKSIDLTPSSTLHESPTRGEWEVIVTDPPRAHWGHILSMAGPGYGYREGNKIILNGFYDDEEARHVANSISRKYGQQGAVVTFGAKRKMEAAEDSHPGAAGAEERRRPGAHRHEKEEPCDHGCPTGECKPFTKLERDTPAFKACMLRASQIGELDSSRKIYDLIHADIEKRDREVFLVITIDFRGQVRDYVEMSIGQRHRVAVDVEDILQAVILSGADGFIVAHCHPSGQAEPSPADRALTKSIEKAAAVACPNIRMVDHIVVGLSQYYSFADKKLYKVK